METSNFRKKVRQYAIEINKNQKSQSQKEQFILKLSMYMALALAILGILFGIVTKTQAIIFDAFVALVSVGLGYLSVVTSRYIYKDDNDIFQYGYVRFEPMVNLFKSLILLIVCVYAFVNAIRGIVKGGYEVDLGGAVVYSIIAFFICLAMFIITRFYSKILESDLIKVDNIEWKIDCVLYLGAIIAFGFVFIFDRNQDSMMSRLIDPALLLVLSALLTISPLRIAIANFKDLIMVAPNDMDEKITQIMENLSNEYQFGDYDTHIAKSGRFYMIEVNILIKDSKDSKISSIKDFDCIREKIEYSLNIPSYKIWLVVSFTGNPKWL
ncbi:cation transporter [Helicobacter sp. 16-1353]|uniref:cation diffusion facilitator family transporter n=1 Tax=Helicobacter sp. 16-1353 TaxID=2004996 RepID=UPI00215B88FE|nr:cation transporter [Helicobacter sp. 16-1353]